MSADNRNWFALYTKPRHEFKAEQELNRLEIENYLPKTTRTRQWSDRKKKITLPLFSGYIFINVNEKERYYALELPYIVKTVSFNGKPSVIPDSEIDNLKRMLAGNPEVNVVDELKEGTTVKVVEGPFKDVEGIVYKTPNNERILAIVINLLKRSVTVLLPTESVIKVK
ncbi:MAG: UpxY family transcription antiterminator [Ignavibacteria bacterium]|jgi:transcription antitermination factor NusG